MTRPLHEGRQADDEDVFNGDEQIAAKAKDILGSMANAVSAMKIFPSDHATVRNFVDVLATKFDGFFEAYPSLRVGIEEYSFTCAGRIVYTDEMIIKSLPFFFFKDGTQTLIFYRGLDRPEILAFLELIKTVAQQPSGEGDIVAALWESDFANIQYHAPDEFVENQILSETRETRSRELDMLPALPSDLDAEVLEIKVDLAKLSSGRIELRPEDREKFQMASAEGRSDVPELATDGSSGSSVSPAASLDPNLAEPELEELESMVRTNRLIRPEEEFLDLTIEVIFLETDLGIVADSLEVLFDFHLDQIARGNFLAAAFAVRKVSDLRIHIETGNTSKAALLNASLQRMTGPRAVTAVAAFLERQASMDWTGLLDFLRLLGPATLPLAAGLFESQPRLEVRDQILRFIEELGGHDPGLVASLANDTRPELSLEIAGILSRMPGQKGVPHLSAFLMSKDRALKLEIVRILGRTAGEVAVRILLGFLNDPNEDVRILATMELNPSEGRSRIAHLLQEASSSAFRKKSLKEKQAILALIGRTGSDEAMAYLAATLRKAPLFPSSSNREMRLAAVAGLEAAATAEAVRTLEEGARGRGRDVREASAAALARLRASIPAREGGRP